MSSSSATLTVPAATPHLRAVRSVSSLPTGAERRHGTPASSHTAAAGTAVPLTSLTPSPTTLAPELLGALPEGAAVVAALPQSALPQGLLAQYGAQAGTAAGAHPLIGYLVLVPAEAAPGTRPDERVPAPPAAPLADRPARPAGVGITVDPDRRTAHVDGRLLDLTYLEFELLAHLTRHPQRVHTRDQLVSAVWGYGHVGDGRTVDVHVARLRRKLGAAHRDSIVTVRRVGYKYAPLSRG
ncbi:winged helix-turn-helix domain-containing protein [Kitasatospora sp. NPDC052896]|uniref:winged helix-turn-helix domain-containing protein n=1 Tax=Kitasatospora sp. NPDC052896 TaxID=3364061 RepID=UPI0037CC052F